MCSVSAEREQSLAELLDARCCDSKATAARGKLCGANMGLMLSAVLFPLPVVRIAVHPFPRA